MSVCERETERGRNRERGKEGACVRLRGLGIRV